MGPSTTPVIDYAPRRASFVRRYAKRLVVLAAALSIAITAFLVREPVERWVMWQYWYRKAVAQPVMNPDPATTMPATQPTRAMREVMDRSRPLMMKQACQIVRATVTPPPDSLEDDVVFAGFVKAGDGRTRFVILSVRDVFEQSPSCLEDTLAVDVFGPPSWFAGVQRSKSDRGQLLNQLRYSALLFDVASCDGQTIRVPVTSTPYHPDLRATDTAHGFLLVRLDDDVRLRFEYEHASGPPNAMSIESNVRRLDFARPRKAFQQ